MNNIGNKKQTRDLSDILVNHWHVFFILGALEGVFAFYKLLSIPADPKNTIFFSLSTSRLMMLFLILVISGLFFLLAFRAYHNENWRKKWLDPQRKRKFFLTIFTLAFISALLCWSSLFITRLYPEEQLIAYYERLSPPLNLLLAISLQTIVWLAVLLFGIHPLPKSMDPSFRNVLFICGLVFLTTWFFIRSTGIGLTPDAVAWGEPGVPLKEWQIWLGGAGSLIFVLFFRRWEKKSPADEDRQKPVLMRFLQSDVLLALLIWLLAVGLWLRVPIPRSYFSLIPRPPNFEIYPYSDAANHDLVAQHILIGDGFENGRVVKRPLLSLFFAVLYLIGGPNYDSAITLQTLVLALFPVALYFIGRQLHSRSTGLIVALWGILRELDILAATPFARVSHSKMLLSDLPAALGISVFLYFVIRWFQTPNKKIYPFISGGILGLLLLVRTQCIFLLVFIFPLALLHFKGKWKKWLTDCLLVCLAIILCITPWVLRNRHFTGYIVFDQTEQTGIIAQRYTDIPGYAMPQRLPDESEQEYTQRFLKNTIQFTLSNPDAVLQFITAHFINNEISTLLVLPVRTSFHDLNEVFHTLSPYWGAGLKELVGWQPFILLLNLMLVSLGIAACYRKWKLGGLLPLIINLAYSLSNALVRNSGGRYILPVDWVGYFYFAAGLIEIMITVLMLFGLKIPAPSDLILNEKRSNIPITKEWKKLLTAGLIFLLSGSMLPLAEVVFPKRYPSLSRQQIEEKLLSTIQTSDSGIDIDELETLLDDENVKLLNGRAMYPVFLLPGEGEPGFGWPFLEERVYSRMAFYLIGQQSAGVVFPQANVVEIPNLADVTLAGCSAEGFIDTIIVSVKKQGQEYIYLRPDFATYKCK